MKHILSLFAAVATLSAALHAADAAPAAAPTQPAPAQGGEAVAVAAVVEAEPESPLSKLSVAGTFGYESAYVFRGEQMTLGSFQSEVELGYALGDGNLYAGAWFNQPIASGEWNELDLNIGYAYEATEALTVDVGYLYYWYPNSAFGEMELRSNELYLGLSYDTTDLMGFNLSPSLYYYYDWNLESHTVEFSLSYSYDLESLVGVAGLALEPSVYLGWNSKGMPAGEWGAVSLGMPTDTLWSSGVYYGASLNLAYQLNDTVGFYAGVRWAGKTYTNEDSENLQNLWGGCGVSFGL